MHTILLVEDEPVVAVDQKAVLTAHGYDVRVVHDGETAVDAAHAHPDIDLVLMDINLGSGMDGAEAAKAILSHRELPVVFLTSHTDREIIERLQAISGYGCVVKSSGEFVLVESIRMALKLFEANTTLKRRTEYIETVVDLLPIGLAATYFEAGQSHYLNSEFERIYGWPFEVLSDIDRFFEAVYPDPDYRNTIKTGVMADIASGDPARMIWDNVRIATQDGEERIVRAQNIPVPDQNLMISTVVDRTAEARTEAALQESERNYRILLESLQEGLLQIDSAGRIVYVNEPMADMIGYESSDMRGQMLTDFMDSEGKQILADSIERRRQGVSEHMEAHFLHRDGHRVYVMVDTAPIQGESGEYAGAIAGIMDISERVSHERELNKQLEEKVVLLRETQHRIKNNIASIASLLSVQASNATEPAVKHPLNQAIARVQSMQKLYDTMLLRDPERTVSLDSYLHSIVELVADLFDAERTVEIREELDECTMTASDAFSIGIIVNELLTNVMKYAFSHQPHPTVSVSLKSNGMRKALCVRDNGQGFPEDHDLDTAKGFGLSLVRMLCEQLDGDLHLYNDNGAVVELSFRSAS